MNKTLKNIPIKLLKISDIHFKLNRLNSKINSLFCTPSVGIVYIKFFNLFYFKKLKKHNFCKFTGKIIKKIDYRNYYSLYYNKCMKKNLPIKSNKIFKLL